MGCGRHLPVGVAFDAERVRRGEDAAASLPWRVTVHLTGNPPKGVLPLRGEPEEVQQTARWHYTHALKQVGGWGDGRVARLPSSPVA